MAGIRVALAKSNTSLKHDFDERIKLVRSSISNEIDQTRGEIKVVRNEIEKTFKSEIQRSHQLIAQQEAEIKQTRADLKAVRSEIEKTFKGEILKSQKLI